jgi:hypothetical protein
MGKTMFRKLAMAFIVTFVPIFLTSSLSLLDDISHNTDGNLNFSLILSLLVSTFMGALAAALRLVLARWTDFVPGDEIHSPGPPDVAIVSTSGTESTAMNAEALDETVPGTP